MTNEEKAARERENLMKLVGFKPVEGKPRHYTHTGIPNEEFDFSKGSPNICSAVSSLFYYGRIAGKEAVKDRIREALGLGD